MVKIELDHGGKIVWFTMLNATVVHPLLTTRKIAHTLKHIWTVLFYMGVKKKVRKDKMS
jgi:hypothetical protein